MYPRLSQSLRIRFIPAILSCLLVFCASAHAMEEEPLPSIAEPSATPVAATPIKKVSARKPRREDLSPEKIDELLARIPEGHPMYYDLRQIVLLGNSPDGYTVEEWLNLSMKFNFRTVAPKK